MMQAFTQHDPDQPLVSVVVTTKNEERNIVNCLRSIQAQSYRRIEIIVVDNYSSDKTQEIARRYTSKVFEKGPERSAQRNYGMLDVASGKYVMYLDADMMLAPDLVESCVIQMEKNICVALHVPEIVLGTSFWSKVRRFERGFYDGTAIDGARFFCRSKFCEVGGFDEKLFVKGSGEDWDVDKKLKLIGSIQLVVKILGRHAPVDNFPLASVIRQNGVNPEDHESVIFHNESTFHLWRYLQKKFYYTLGFDGYRKKWGDNDPDIGKQFGVWYRYVGVFIENGKWCRIVRHPLLSLGMIFLRVLVGFTYLFRKIHTLFLADEKAGRASRV